MTSHTCPSSPGSAGSTLRRNGRGSPQSDRLNKQPTQTGSPACGSDDASRDGQTSGILRQMTLNGELASTARPSSAAGSHASRSPVPGSAEAKKMTVTSGRKCLESCGSSGPLGSLERMLLDSSQWESRIVLLTWKVKGIPSGHSLFQLVASVPSTGENGCSLLPTPTTQEVEHLKIEISETGRRISSTGTTHNIGLADVVKMWPTPTAPGPHQVGRIEEWGGSGNPLRMLPTMTARDFRAPGLPERREERAAERSLPLTEVIGGMLNPPWVEWLMGFPIGWTDCDVSGTRSSRNRCIRSLRVSHRLRRRR